MNLQILIKSTFIFSNVFLPVAYSNLVLFRHIVLILIGSKIVKRNLITLNSNSHTRKHSNLINGQNGEELQQ